MSGGSDRLRHRNNFDPFFVTVTAKAKVSATTLSSGNVTFSVLRGGTGSRSISFHLASNNSDFLKYDYLTYGIRYEEYKKLANIISVPMKNAGSQLLSSMNIPYYLFLMYIIKQINLI
ncbi:unnamed protein product [Leptidea sinapis]|nr:unnamed protein product [Leptidea sinapis]